MKGDRMMKHTCITALRWLCVFGFLACMLCACSRDDEAGSTGEPLLVSFVLPGISGGVTPDVGTRAALDEGAKVTVLAYKVGGVYSQSNLVASAEYTVGADGALIPSGNGIRLKEDSYDFFAYLNGENIATYGDCPRATVYRYVDFGYSTIRNQAVVKWTTAEGSNMARSIQLAEFSRACARVTFRFSLSKSATSDNLKSMKITLAEMTNLSDGIATMIGTDPIPPKYVTGSVAFPVANLVADKSDPMDISGSYVVLPKSNVGYSFTFGVQFNGVTTMTSIFRTGWLPALAYEPGKEYTYTVTLNKNGYVELWLAIDHWNRHEWTTGVGGVPTGPISTQLLGYWDTISWSESLGQCSPGEVGNVTIDNWQIYSYESVLGSSDTSTLK